MAAEAFTPRAGEKGRAHAIIYSIQFFKSRPG